MTITDRPYASSKTRYRELIRLAERCNGAELLVSGDDWDILLECIPGAMKHVEAESLMHNGRRWRHKPPGKPPQGIYDLTGEEPMRVDE